MLEELLLTSAATVFAVSIGSYIGTKMIKRELKKEISTYITNELPHLLESEEVKARARGWVRGLVREAIDVGREELGIGLLIPEDSAEKVMKDEQE